MYHLYHTYHTGRKAVLSVPPEKVVRVVCVVRLSGRCYIFSLLVSGFNNLDNDEMAVF